MLGIIFGILNRRKNRFIQVKPNPVEEKNRWMRKYAPMILSSLFSAVLAVVLYKQFEQPREVIIRETLPARYTTQNGEDVLTGEKFRSVISAAPTSFAKAAHSVTSAVVNIKTFQEDNGFPLFGSHSYSSASSGSGVIVSPDGYIVTNNHVIADGGIIEVTLNDKREMRAEVIGVDESTDLALIRVKDGDNLPFLPFGNSDSLHVGEWVLAVGNPFDLESTVTAGIVSAKGRSIDILEGNDRIESFIQTDAAVNPGNSGGALVNTNGELIGINTAIITRTGRYEGYSFAVPSNLAAKVVRDLREYGVVQRGILGVFIEDLTNRQAKELGLPLIEGVYVSRITPGSGAEEAGLKPGDVLLGINGVKIRTRPEMQEQLGRYHPGNAVMVEYYRKGQTLTAEVILKDRSNSTSIVTAAESDILHQLGFELRNLTKEEKKRLKVNGVRVASIYLGSTIEKTNMDPGFVITRVGSQKVASVEELVKVLELASGKVILEGVYENYKGEYYYEFTRD